MNKQNTTQNLFMKEADCFLIDKDGNFSKSIIKEYHCLFDKIIKEADDDGFLSDEDFFEIQIISIAYSNKGSIPSLFKISYEEFCKMGKPVNLILKEKLKRGLA